MITLTLRIVERETGIAVFDEVERFDATPNEEEKLKVFTEAIRKAALKEAERLHKLGVGKSRIAPEEQRDIIIAVSDSPALEEI